MPMSVDCVQVRQYRIYLLVIFLCHVVHDGNSLYGLSPRIMLSRPALAKHRQEFFFASGSKVLKVFVLCLLCHRLRRLTVAVPPTLLPDFRAARKAALFCHRPRQWPHPALSLNNAAAMASIRSLQANWSSQFRDIPLNP